MKYSNKTVPVFLLSHYVVSRKWPGNKYITLKLHLRGRNEKFLIYKLIETITFPSNDSA